MTNVCCLSCHILNLFAGYHLYAEVISNLNLFSIKISGFRERVITIKYYDLEQLIIIVSNAPE